LSKLELIATATFGLEAVVKREIERLGFKVTCSEDGKITYLADERGIVRSNLNIRCADRILLKMGEFKAETSEELFQQTKGLPWEEWITEDGKFTVNCTTVKSKLRSEPACQKTVKKAIVDRLASVYMRNEFLETGAEYTVKVTLLKDIATLTIDTSGAGLHKRGYRVKNVEAPIKETLAAALVQLSFWKADRMLIDPFCGSGTITMDVCINSLLPKGKKILIINNGTYSMRAVEICEYYNLPFVNFDCPIDEIPKSSKGDWFARTQIWCCFYRRYNFYLCNETD